MFNQDLKHFELFVVITADTGFACKALSLSRHLPVLVLSTTNGG